MLLRSTAAFSACFTGAHFSRRRSEPVASALVKQNPQAEVDVSLLVGGLTSILEGQGITKGDHITLRGQQWPSEFALIGLIFAAVLENWRDEIGYKDLEKASSM
jgi:hypothetical protein